VGPISHTQLTHTAQVIYENKPDFVSVQEIESLEVIDEFYSKFIRKKYNQLPYHMLIEGNDPRGIDLGLLLDNNSFPGVNTITTDTILILQMLTDHSFHVTVLKWTLHCLKAKN